MAHLLGANGARADGLFGHALPACTRRAARPGIPLGIVQLRTVERRSGTTLQDGDSVFGLQHFPLIA
jgi:hypothetical protein